MCHVKSRTRLERGMWSYLCVLVGPGVECTTDGILILKQSRLDGSDVER